MLGVVALIVAASTLAANIAILVTVIRTHREVKTPNGRTLAQTVLDAEPHHQSTPLVVSEPTPGPNESR